jgi:ABC-2 type transport system permease protein
MKNSRFMAALFATSIKSSLASRAAFLVQCAFMALNNLLYFSVWWILFRRFGSIRGFRLEDMLLLFGVSAAGFGLAVVACGGMLELARTIAEGELDALLVQPKSVLIRALCSRSIASGWGDILSGAVLLALWGHGHPIAALLAVVLAAVGFAASASVLHSSAFWLGRADQLARSAFEFVISFTLYPPSVFGGGVRLVLFTLLPAGLIAYLPVELVRTPNVRTLLTALLGTTSYALFATWLFHRGLRHYASGSRFVARD